MTKEVIRGYKFRIYPNEEQKNKIEKHFSCCRYVYNGMLAYRQHRYKDFGEKYSKFDLNKKLTEIKKSDTWLKEVDSKSLLFAIRDMDRAYENFFKGKGKFPKFKSKRNNKQSYTTCQLNVKDNLINLPKIGKMKIRLHNGFDKDFHIESECTVSKAPTGKYYVSILWKETIETYNKVNKEIGIDLGVKTFATTSDCEFFKFPKKVWKEEKRIQFLQKKLSRQKRGSNRYEKTRILIAKHHEKITNIRKDFLNKLSTKCIKENQLIALENLNVKGMMKNRKLARAIGRMGFYQFRSMLESKAKWHDRNIKIIDRWFPSSKTCSNCGHIKEDLKLSDRTYVCPNCGLVIDRDYNASINILLESKK